MIDFPISNFSNSGINNIQVYITKKPRSLVAHIGTGRHYNINSKRGRIQIIVPNEELVNSIYNTNINALFSNIDYIRRNPAQTSLCSITKYLTPRKAIPPATL